MPETFDDDEFEVLENVMSVILAFVMSAMPVILRAMEANLVSPTEQAELVSVAATMTEMLPQVMRWAGES